MVGPLDVAFLLGSPDISGGSNVIFEHALGLQARGHRVAIVTARAFDPARLAWHPRARALAFLDHAACRARQFDVAVATWWRTVFDLPAVPARRRAYFVQSIETRFCAPDDPESRALVDLGYRLPLPIVTEAHWIAAHLRDHYDRDATVVRNGVDKTLFSATGPVLDATRPLGLRALVEGHVPVGFKRVPLAVRLCRQAGLRDVWLLTGSDVDAYPGVTRVLSRLPITEVPAVYRSCDVLVKLSTVEGMFGPPLEMMHCGGTAVTSDVTGYDEYVRDGMNALVVARGEEPAVVDALRRLAADPALLARLRRGGLETAAAWPTWDDAVREMETFLVRVAGSPYDAERAEQEQSRLLRAALDLAGPLWVARRHEYPGRILARVGAKLAAKGLARLGLALPTAPAPAEPLPVPETPLPPAAGVAASGGRICFVGDRARHRAYAPAQVGRSEARFLDAVPPWTALHDELRGLAPDATIVFAPEHLPPDALRELPGSVIGVVVHDTTPATLGTLRDAFPLTPVGPTLRAVVHPDQAAVAGLRREGVNAIGAFLPPVDAGSFDAPEDGAWAVRPIPVVVAVAAAGDAQQARRALRERFDALELVGVPLETMLGPVLAGARVSVRPETDPLAAGRMMRDMLAGCLVVARPPAADHGLLAGEHYLAFADDEALVETVRLALLTPERFDVVRRVGMARARELADPERWLPLLGGEVDAEHPAALGAAR